MPSFCSTFRSSSFSQNMLSISAQTISKSTSGKLQVFESLESYCFSRSESTSLLMATLSSSPAGKDGFVGPTIWRGTFSITVRVITNNEGCEVPVPLVAIIVNCNMQNCKFHEMHMILSIKYWV